MSVVQGYLWACAAGAVLISVVLGLCMLIGGGVSKGVKKSPWPLVGGVTAVLLCVQVGYLAAPLALRAEGAWWMWALASMCPPALLSLLALSGNLMRVVRQRIVERQPATLRPTMTITMLLQALMYVCAPVVLWLARSPLGG
ncbi:MAG: hypothetical protein QM783_06415 [Phycisphaerales bacterium]